MNTTHTQHWNPDAYKRNASFVSALGHPLLKLLHAAPHTSEALADASGWTLPKVLATLTELEMDGRAGCDNGRWFARVS